MHASEGPGGRDERCEMHAEEGERKVMLTSVVLGVLVSAPKQHTHRKSHKDEGAAAERAMAFSAGDTGKEITKSPQAGGRWAGGQRQTCRTRMKHPVRSCRGILAQEGLCHVASQGLPGLAGAYRGLPGPTGPYRSIAVNCGASRGQLGPTGSYCWLPGYSHEPRIGAEVQHLPEAVLHIHLLPLHTPQNYTRQAPDTKSRTDEKGAWADYQQPAFFNIASQHDETL